MSTSAAAAYGLATLGDDDVVLDVWFPDPALVSEADSGTVVVSGADVPLESSDLLDLAGEDELRGVRQVVVHTQIASLADDPADSYDAYLRLHLLSSRTIRPHEASVNGIFGKLTNVVWTNHGPCPVETFASVRAKLRGRGPVTVYSVDKFPRMVDYIIPTGVRIADADRVRLGAYLAEGTTVMHEGFVNFNAGTLGNAMVEGRISAGVVVGNDSDIGGSASIMGTLSGGGKETISIGERCLIGANGGVGISLGDDCVVEAGCYVTAGSKILMPDGTTKRGSELSGQNGILFLRNSVTGAIEARTRQGGGVVLNDALHAN